MHAIAIAATNPFRLPNWRWERARNIREERGPAATRRRDTPIGAMWINRALQFQERLQEAETPRRHLALAEQMPDIYWAHYAHTNSLNSIKYVIEAFLLARVDSWSIGARCGAAVEVIDAYEALFFNVREKLQHRSYILHCVLGDAIQRGITDREYDLLWKLYGYFIGPHVVEALESGFANPVWCGSPDSVNAAVQDDAINTLKLKAAIAAKTVPVNRMTQTSLMELFTKFIEVERNTDSSGKAQEQILDHISAMMTALPFNVGGRDPRGGMLPSTPAQAFEKTAIELTYEEVMRLSVGQPIANADVLRRLEYPVTESTQLLEGSKS